VVREATREGEVIGSNPTDREESQLCTENGAKNHSASGCVKAAARTEFAPPASTKPFLPAAQIISSLVHNHSLTIVL
jgi:hypothetical protein